MCWRRSARRRSTSCKWLLTWCGEDTETHFWCCTGPLFAPSWTMVVFCMAQHRIPNYGNWTAYTTLDWDWYWERSAPAPSPVSTEANEAPLEERCLKLSMHYYLQFMFNFIKGDTSEVFIDTFVYNSNVHQYNTRQSHLLHIPTVRSNLGKRNLRYNGAVIWNELQSFININCSLYSFKRQLKLIFLRC